jgi:hypothetical protein
MIEKIKDLEGRIATLEEALKNVLRVGTVVTRDATHCRVRVQFKDNDGLVSYWCQVLMKKTLVDKKYWLPDVGELAICAFLPFGHEQGFVLGSAYNDEDRIPPSANGDRLVLLDRGGNEVLMDRLCRKVRIITDEIHVVGRLVVHGEVFDALGTLTHHTNDRLPRDPGNGPPPWDCGE